MITDSEHFNSLTPPLSPNQDEIEIYQKYITDHNEILLLGYTKELIKFADISVDLNFPENLNALDDIELIKDDWFNIPNYGKKYGTIIGDGVLNLVGGSLVERLRRSCDRLIIRFFTSKINGMKYATYFAHNTNFLLPDKIIDTQESCKILMWNFNKSLLPTIYQ